MKMRGILGKEVENKRKESGKTVMRDERERCVKRQKVWERMRKGGGEK